jgi:hypothetical protein
MSVSRVTALDAVLIAGLHRTRLRRLAGTAAHAASHAAARATGIHSTRDSQQPDEHPGHPLPHLHDQLPME